MRPGLGVGQQVTTATEEINWQAAQAAVNTMSGKWTIPVVAALFRGPKRYGSLRRTIDGAVSDKVLAETLRRMEREGLLTRRVVTVATETTPAVFYSLSGTARSLAAPLALLAEWQNHRPITEK